jgi:hypothetical protein
MTDSDETARSDNGQFASSEPLYGKEALERDAGYIPMPDEKKKEQAEAEELTTREAAAERLKQLSGAESNIVTHVSGLPANVTMTLDQASQALVEAREADKTDEQQKSDKAMQAEIDDLRGTPPEAKEAKTADTDAEPDIEKVLSHPKVREALDKHVTEAESTRQLYANGVEEARKFSMAALFSDMPELMNLPVNQWQSALVALSQREPGRFRQALNRINTIAQVEAVHKHFNQQKTAYEQAEFKTYAQKEDARFADMVKGETPARMAAIEAEIPALLKDLGVDPTDFFRLGNESKFLRSAAAQKILVDAAKYRLLMKTAKPRPSPAPIPPVVRPGAATNRTAAERGSANIAALSAKLKQTGSIKDATALLIAKRGRTR